MTRSVDSLKDKHEGKSGVLLCPGPTLESFDPGVLTYDCVVMAANLGLMQNAVADYWIVSNWFAWGQALPSLFPEETQLVTPKGVFDEGDRRFDSSLDDACVIETTKEPRSSLLAVVLANIMGIDDLYIFGLDCFRPEYHYYFQKGIKPDHLTENRLIGYERIYGSVKYKAYETKRLKELIVRFRDVGKHAMNIKIVDSPWSRIDNELIDKITVEEFEAELWQKASHAQLKKEVEDEVKKEAEDEGDEGVEID